MQKLRLRKLRRHRHSNLYQITRLRFRSDITLKVVKEIVREQSVDNRLFFLYIISVLNELIHLYFLIQ